MGASGEEGEVARVRWGGAVVGIAIEWRLAFFQLIRRVRFTERRRARFSARMCR